MIDQLSDLIVALALLQAELAVRPQKSRKQMKERKNRVKKLRGKKKGDAKKSK